MNNISKISFLFLAYAVVAGGYVSQLLPCQTQKILNHSISAKHLMGFLLIFCFIMMEGGWDFSQEENDKEANDWSSGNTLHSIVWAVLLYSVFVLTSKMKLTPNLIFFGLLFFIYIVNTYRVYIHNRNRISDKTNEKILLFTKILLGVAALVFGYAIVDYYKYQKMSYGKNFSSTLFLVGTSKCSSE